MKVAWGTVARSKFLDSSFLQKHIFLMHCDIPEWLCFIDVGPKASLGA